MTLHSRWQPIHLLFAGLAVWGLLLAMGAAFMVNGRWNWEAADWRKGVIVLACEAVFLGVWALALALRRPSKATRRP